MSFAVILSKPPMAENIGFGARNMGNFGISDLRMIAPRDGWPQEKSFDVAKNIGFEILQNVRVFETLEDASFDLNFIYATTIRDRFMQKETVGIKNLKKDLSMTRGKF